MYYIYNDHLSHHGILGQKWGVRRYQNPDGSLTDAGRKRLAKATEHYAQFRSKLKPYTSKDAILLKDVSIDGYNKSDTAKKIFNEYNKVSKKAEDAAKDFEKDEKRVKDVIKKILKFETGIGYSTSDEDINIFYKQAMRKDTYTYEAECLWDYYLATDKKQKQYSDAMWNLDKEYYSNAEKYFKELLGDKYNKKVKDLHYPNSTDGLMLSEVLAKKLYRDFPVR